MVHLPLLVTRFINKPVKQAIPGPPMNVVVGDVTYSM